MDVDEGFTDVRFTDVPGAVKGNGDGGFASLNLPQAALDGGYVATFLGGDPFGVTTPGAAQQHHQQQQQQQQQQLRPAAPPAIDVGSAGNALEGQFPGFFSPGYSLASAAGSGLALPCSGPVADLDAGGGADVPMPFSLSAFEPAGGGLVPTPKDYAAAIPADEAKSGFYYPFVVVPDVESPSSSGSSSVVPSSGASASSEIEPSAPAAVGAQVPPATPTPDSGAGDEPPSGVSAERLRRWRLAKQYEYLGKLSGASDPTQAGVVRAAVDVLKKYETRLRELERVQAYEERLAASGGRAVPSREAIDAQAAAAASEAHYSAFLHAGVAVSVALTDGRVIDVNREMEELLKSTKAELTNLTVFTINHPDFAPKCYQMVNRLLVGERTVEQGRGKIVNCIGDIMCVHVTAYAVRVDGRIKYIVSVLHPIEAVPADAADVNGPTHVPRATV